MFLHFYDTKSREENWNLVKYFELKLLLLLQRRHNIQLRDYHYNYATTNLFINCICSSWFSSSSSLHLNLNIKKNFWPFFLHSIFVLYNLSKFSFKLNCQRGVSHQKLNVRKHFFTHSFKQQHNLSDSDCYLVHGKYEQNFRMMQNAIKTTKLLFFVYVNGATIYGRDVSCWCW